MTKFLVFLGVLVAQLTFAQCIIRGVVTDTLQKPIAFGNITLLSTTLDSLQLGLTQTNEQGKFKVIVSDTLKEVLISASLIGYETLTQKLSLPKDSAFLLQKPFVLRHNSYVLKEVIIAEKPTYLESGDTLTINVKRFSDSTERNLGDLLSKIPDFKVESDGTIKYKDKKVDNVLVEGSDITQSDYKTLTKNFSAKVIEDVQVINNFSDNPLLADFEDNKGLALNLRIQEKFKNVWMLDEEISVGLPQRYNVYSEATLIQKRNKLIVLGKQNTLGDLSSDEVEITYTAKPEEITHLGTANHTIDLYAGGGGSVDSKLYEKNESKMLQLSWVKNFKKAWEIQLKGGVSRDIQQFKQISKESYFLTEPAFTIDGTYQFYKRDNQANVKTTLIYYPNSKHRAVYKGYISNPILHTEQHAYTNISTANSRSTTFTPTQSHALEYGYKIKQGKVLLTKADFKRENVSNLFQTIQTPQLLLPLVSSPQDTVFQKISQQKNEFHARSSLITKKYAIYIGYQYESQPLMTGIDTLNYGLYAIDSLRNNIRYQWQNAYIKTERSWKVKKIKFSVNLRAMYSSFKSQNRITNVFTPPRNQFLFLPRISLRWKYIALSYLRQVDLPNTQTIMENYIFSGYRSFYQGSGGNIYPTVGHTASANIGNKSKKEFSVSLGISGTYKKGLLANQKTIDSLYNATTVLPDAVSQLSNNVVLNSFKHFNHLKQWVSANIMYTQTQSVNRTNGLKNVTNMQIRSGTLNLYSFEMKYIRYNLKASYQNMVNTITLTPIGTQTQTKNQSIALKGSISGRWKTFRLSYEHDYWKIYTQQQQQHFDWVNLTFYYEPEKDWSLGITAYNFLNRKEYLENNINTQGQSFIQLPLLGRLWVLEFSYYLTTKEK